MKKEISNIEEINNSIDNLTIFQLQLNTPYSDFEESINSLYFSDNKKYLYIQVTNFGKLSIPNNEGQFKIYNYNLDFTNLDEIIHNNFHLLFADRSGNIKCNFEFIGCKLEDIAEMKLEYNLDKKFKTYIISISYENIFKIFKE